MHTPHRLACVLASLALLTSAFAQSSSSSARQSGPEVSRADRGFIEKAAKSGMKEVMVSEAVLPMLTQTETKEFAQMMVRDHTMANNELMALAQQKGVELPQKDDRLARKWSDKSKNIDEDYMKEMVSDHKKTIELFEKGARSDDPDIAAFAQKTLPKLQQHLQMAEGRGMSH